jgi:enoyl ACP reductase
VDRGTSEVELLSGKRLLFTGVLTSGSIAFAAAAAAQRAGAEVALTGFGRTLRLTERAAQQLSGSVPVFELDARRPADYARLAERVHEHWGCLDGLLHAIAYAPKEALNGAFMQTPDDAALECLRTSAYSLKSLTAALLPAFRLAGGGSVVALHLDHARALRGYDWMGVAKGTLASIARYLCAYVGGDGVRVNLVAAGLLRTPAASAFEGFGQRAQAWSAQTPLGWDPADPTPVADAIVFLFSPLSRGVTGEILHVDGGAHAVEAPPALAPGARRF